MHYVHQVVVTDAKSKIGLKPFRKMGQRPSFWYITRKTSLDLYGLIKFHANPKKSSNLGFFQKLQARLKIKNWPKTLPENGLKTSFLVYDQENIFIFIWYIQILRQPQTKNRRFLILHLFRLPNEHSACLMGVNIPGVLKKLVFWGVLPV